MKKRIVLALGGNALGDNNEAQIAAIDVATQHIMEFIKEGHEVVIVHGNGPQVGKIQLAFSTATKHDDNLEEMPLPEAIAMSQGYIGYHLQQSLINRLKKEGLDIPVATILTHSVVDASDPSFSNPTKPIGPFYDLEEVKDKNIKDYVEDSGRGYRMVVASPKPQDIVEIEAIKKSVDQGTITICAGGGGIPVVNENDTFNSVNAVIDKDAAAALLADLLDADKLIILTGVDKVAINFGTKDVEWLESLNLETLQQYIDEGQFAPGSMLPKIEAAQRFVQNHPNSQTIITSLEAAKEALQGKNGTIIYN